MENGRFFDLKGLQVKLVNIAAFRADPEEILDEGTAECGDFLELLECQGFNGDEERSSRFPQCELVVGGQ